MQINTFFITPAPKNWFSTTVEALESDLFPPAGGKVEITNIDRRKVKNADSAGNSAESGNPHKLVWYPCITFSMHVGV